ncbi:reverse transcriptase [Gossypium australe]|uniref:Reverse transcriptase n=1 Tax=Gossypium australe TaxID=47621 RepID=A0A5B6WIA2_9ROSI|nr:reverse transcriptase [Gossypium australe]
MVSVKKKKVDENKELVGSEIVEIQIQFLLNRRLLIGKPTEHNEKSMLERPWIGEFTGSSEAALLNQAASSPIVEAEGSKGGLCLAWKKDLDVKLKSFSKWHIDVLIKEENVEEDWRFTGFYGSPYSKDKNSVWDLLKRLAQESDYPWLVEGDFNEILYSFEKCGGIPRDSKRMEVFRETLVDCQLYDIGFSGVSYTWERGNLPETNIRERLDRGVANEKWLMLFPSNSIQHLPYSISDHCPLLLETNKRVTFTGGRKFHFEAWWTMEKSLENVIRESWEDWSRTTRRNKEGLKKKLMKELEVLTGGIRDDDTMA